MQEALQQLQAQWARVAALELQIEQTRAMTAEQEGSTLIQTLGAVRTDRGGAMVDTKGIGQPFMLKGGCRPRLRRVDTQSAYVRSCLQGSEIRFSLLWVGQHDSEKSLSKVADLRRETALCTGSLPLENKATMTD